MNIAQLVLLMLTLTCSPVFAGQPLSVVGSEWPPYVDEHRPDGGLSIDLVRRVLDQAGYHSLFMLENDTSRALAGARFGVYDIISNIRRSEELARDVDVTDAVLSNEPCFIKRKSSDIAYALMRELNGKKVGVINNMPYPPEFIAAGEVVKVSLPDLAAALNALAAGELDLVLGDKREIEYILFKYMPNDIKALDFLPQCFQKTDLYAGISRINPEHAKILQDFNLALARMKQNGSYQAIIDKHIPGH